MFLGHYSISAIREDRAGENAAGASGGQKWRIFSGAYLKGNWQRSFPQVFGSGSVPVHGRDIPVGQIQIGVYRFG
jgi:hypothetical protein